MDIKSVPTRGRTLDHAAFVYDFFEPILMLGKQADYDKHIFLIFLSALAVGITDAMIRNSVNLYSGHITGFKLPFSLKPETLYIKGVADVLRRTPAHGLLISRDQVETVTLIGIDPVAEVKRTAVHRKITAGRFPRNDEQAILSSQALAENLKVRAGDYLKAL